VLPGCPLAFLTPFLVVRTQTFEGGGRSRPRSVETPHDPKIINRWNVGSQSLGLLPSLPTTQIIEVAFFYPPPFVIPKDPVFLFFPSVALFTCRNPQSRFPLRESPCPPKPPRLLFPALPLLAVPLSAPSPLLPFFPFFGFWSNQRPTLFLMPLLPL